MTVAARMHPTGRSALLCWALGLACLATLVVPAIPAAGQASAAGQLLALINGDRAEHGVAPVSLNASLSAIAQGQANAMAAARRIFQNPAFPNDVPAANSAGENVGYGPDPSSVHAAFVASPEHQVIIVDGAYHLVGIAVASSPIGLMVVEDFVDTVGGLVVPPVAPPPPAAAPPVAVPRPAAPPVAVPKPAPPVVAPAPSVIPPPVAAAPAAPPAPPAPPAAVPTPVPTPTPSPQPPPPPTFDMGLYTRMLQWEQWQTGSSSGR